MAAGRSEDTEETVPPCVALMSFTFAHYNTGNGVQELLEVQHLYLHDADLDAAVAAGKEVTEPGFAGTHVQTPGECIEYFMARSHMRAVLGRNRRNASKPKEVLV